MAAEVDAWRPGWRVQRLRVLNQWQEWQMTCSHEARSWPRAQCACCWVRSFPAPYQGEVKRGSPSLFVDVSLGVLNMATAERKGPGGKKDIPELTDTVVAQESQNNYKNLKAFQLLYRRWCPTVCCEKVLKKEVKKPRSRAPKISVLSLHVSCSRHGHIALKKRCTESWGGGCWIY